MSVKQSRKQGVAKCFPQGSLATSRFPKRSLPVHTYPLASKVGVCGVHATPRQHIECYWFLGCFSAAASRAEEVVYRDRHEGERTLLPGQVHRPQATQYPLFFDPIVHWSSAPGEGDHAVLFGRVGASRQCSPLSRVGGSRRSAQGSSNSKVPGGCPVQPTLVYGHPAELGSFAWHALWTVWPVESSIAAQVSLTSLHCHGSTSTLPPPIAVKIVPFFMSHPHLHSWRLTIYHHNQPAPWPH